MTTKAVVGGIVNPLVNTSLVGGILGGVTVPDFSPADLIGDSTFARYFTVRDSITGFSDDDAFAATIPDLSGNGNDFTGSGLTYKLDANGFAYLDIASATGTIDFNFTNMPDEFTYVWVGNNAGDTLGYQMNSKGENKGIGLIQPNNDNPTDINFTATQQEVSYDGRIFDSPDRSVNFNVFNQNGTVVALHEYSGASSNTAPTSWNIGQSGLPLEAEVYAVFIIDRHLSSQEKANLISYLGALHGNIFNGLPTQMDVMICGGQSNMVGRNTDNLATPVVVDNGSLLYTSATRALTPLADPTSQFTLGQTMIPAFSNTWFGETGNPIIAINSAANSSKLLPYATEDWGSNGNNHIALLLSAANLVDDLEFNTKYEINEVYTIFQQGESEVANYNGTTITETAYEAAIETLGDDWDTDLSATFGEKYKGLWVILLSSRYEATDYIAQQLNPLTDRVPDYNTAYTNAVRDNINVNMAYEGSASFLSRGLHSDPTHWSSVAEQQAGRCSALRISGSASAPDTPISPFIDHSSYVGATVLDEVNPTHSHTCGSGTTCLIVAVVAANFTTSAEELLLDASFDGVDMSRGGLANNENNGEITSAIFYLNTDDYGADLADVTGDIAITSRARNGQAKAANAILVSAVNAKDVYAFERMRGNNGLTATDTASHSIEPILGSMLINCTGAILDDTTPSTASVSNMTEIVDAAFIGSKSVQMSLSHNVTDARVSVTPSVVFGDTMDEIASISVALRAKIKGEA